MSKWTIDADHSVAAFSVRHMMIAKVHGQFNKISGTIEFDPSDISRTSIAIEINAGSIFTGIKKRDDHLRSQDFFDSDKYQTITFQSTKTEKTGFSNFKITGGLTLRGITRSVTMELNFSGPVNSPYGETTMGFSGQCRVNREEFGIMWNEPIENGGFMVGKDIEVIMELEADLVQ